MMFDENTYVIIGNGAAGYYAADAIRKHDPDGGIHIISEEKLLTYFRPQLSKFIGFPIDSEKFLVSPESWYNNNNIKVTLKTKVKKINPDQKLLLLSDGSIIKYSKLILANGSHAFVPPVPGNDKENVFSLKSINDAEAIKKQLSVSKNAVVIGGGLLGLEAAWSMHHAGLNVTVLERSEGLLTKQLDAEGAKIFKSMVDDSGVNIMLNASTEEILGDTKVTGIKLTSGAIVPADIVLFSSGVRPNKELAEQSGISADKGVIVNDRMETSKPDIYACGDVAEFNGKVFGNWPAAMNMGKIAGANASGSDMQFKEFVTSFNFDSLNIKLFSCGSFTENNESVAHKDPATNAYMKLYFESDKIIGGFLIGDTKRAPEVLNSVKAGLSYEEAVEKFGLQGSK
ncbi:MAG: NAD(P)/FAD-dependent oxidoreductase [Clostridiaceae bacterium]